MATPQVIRPHGELVKASTGGAKIIQLNGSQFWSRSLFTPPPTTIRGITTSDWFGPGQPVSPIAPLGTEPRGWNYPPDTNLIYTPRAMEEYSAQQLRDFSMYPLVRFIIENCKDTICTLPWQLRVKPQPGESNRQRLAREQSDNRVGKLTEFLEHPNADCSWKDFIQMWMDDVLTIDAPAIYLRRTRSGDVAEWRVLDGGLIARYIDKNGWTPQAGNPAYAQLWYGMPMLDLTTDQLIYRPRKPRSYKLYGFSPTEQAVEYIKMGMGRLELQNQFFQNGSIPDGIQVVPPNISPEIVERNQAWLNSTLSGNLARRVQMRLIWGFQTDGKHDQILFPKEKALTDELDELLIRILCYAYGASPTRLLRPMNRASAEQNQEAAIQEGVEPYMAYIVDTVNYILQRKMGYKDIEFAWQEKRDTDIDKQAQADQIYLENGVDTINEVRERKGQDPSPDPAANKLAVKTAQGYVPIGETLSPNGGKGPEGEGGPQGGGPAGNAPGGQRSSGGGQRGEHPDTGTVEHPEEKAAHCRVHDSFQKSCVLCHFELGKASAARALPAAPGSRAEELTQLAKEVKALILGGKPHTHKHATTQVTLQGEDANAVREAGRKLIADEDLAGNGRELQPHITIKYGVNEDHESLALAMANYDPFEVTLGKTFTFPPTENSDFAAPVLAHVESSELPKLHNTVHAAIGCKSDDFEYTPHVTLAYVKPEAAKKYEDSDALEGMKIQVRSITLAKKDGTAVEVPLGAAGKAARSFFALSKAASLGGHWVTIGSGADEKHILIRETSARAKRALEGHKPATRAKQQIAHAMQEKVAKTVGGENTPDNHPFDVLKGKAGIEVKTLVDQTNDKLTMHPESLQRKMEHAKDNKLKSTHTVAIDKRGGKEIVYYRKGLGSFRLDGMEKISWAKLKGMF